VESDSDVQCGRAMPGFRDAVAEGQLCTLRFNIKYYWQMLEVVYHYDIQIYELT